MNTTNLHDVIPVFREELALCAVREGELVAVLSEVGQQADYVTAAMFAARDLGARVVNVNLLPAASTSLESRAGNIVQNPLAGNPAALDLLKSADMVIDLVYLLFSREQIEIQAAGTRILMVVEPLDVLTRLFPSPALRSRVEAAEARLNTAKELRFTNPAGTDVTYQLGAFPTLTEYGYTDTPGRWDHWPGGLVATSAHETGVNGRVIMDRGDIIYPFKSYVHSPITFTIRDGYIVEIEGGLDARLVREYMESFKDPRAFAVSHIGWGLNEHADWIAIATGVNGIGMDGRVYYGGVLFSTGPNTEFGGDNDTPCHLDLPMRNCSLYLDDDLIVSDGVILPQGMRSPGR